MKQTGHGILKVDAIGAVVCAALTAAAWFTIIRPIQQENLELTRLRADLETQQATRLELERERDGLSADVTRVTHELEETRISLQPAQQMNAKIAMINELLESSSMLIEGTEVGTVRSEKWFQSVPVTISGSGRFSSCAAFMHRLHQEMPDTGIVGFRLTGSPRSTSAPGRFELDLVWHAAPLIATAPDRH